jgi:hypothetical protein
MDVKWWIATFIGIAAVAAALVQVPADNWRWLISTIFKSTPMETASLHIESAIQCPHHDQ